MNQLDEQLLRAYFRMEEAQRQRTWMERIWHPEKINWIKRGAPPPMTRTKEIRREELEHLGFGEAHYQRMRDTEDTTKAELERLASTHPLWEHFRLIRGLGLYLCGAYVAAVGDIERAPTVSAHWKGMGLDVLPDGSVPRRIRGLKKVERRVPAMPHVTRVGEQIREQIKRGGATAKLYQWYRKFRVEIDGRKPDRAKMFNMKHSLRLTQKILYACLWREHRLAWGLDAPDPYAFAILKHADGNLIRIQDFYQD